LSTSIEIPPGSGDIFVFPDQFQGPGYLTRFPELCTALAALSQGAIDDAAAAQLAASLAQTFALTSTTSTTSRTIGTGSMSFTMADQLPLIAGNYVMIPSQANPTTNWMWGQVTSRVGLVLTVSVQLTAGAGTFADWAIQLSSPRGPTGATGGVSSVNTFTGAVTLGVANISGAAPLASPALTGTPTAPTATGGTNTTQIATTAFVQTALAGAGVGLNRIINGNFRVMQLSGSTTVNSATRVYPIDRWQAFGVASAGTFTVSRSSGASGYPYMLTATVGTAAASPGASDSYAILHRIEGPQVADLGFGASGAQSITLSFIVRSSVTGTFSGSIRNGAANRSWPFTYSIPTANTPTTISVTITGDTSGTWPITAGSVGLDVIFCLGSGSSGLGAAGNWAAANYFGATGSVNLMATAGATWSIANVQLERGTAATTFDFRPYAAELALCQRYLQVMAKDGSSQTYFAGMVETASTASYVVPLVPPMAVAPTVTFEVAPGYFAMASAGVGVQTCSAITASYTDSTTLVVGATNAYGGASLGTVSRLLSGTTNASRIIVRAEL
jgi:hypothetical protein